MLYFTAGMPTRAQWRMIACTSSISRCRSGSRPSMIPLRTTGPPSGFTACCGDIRSMDADDSIGNCTMSSDTPCDSQRSRSRDSDSTVHAAGSCSPGG